MRFAGQGYVAQPTELARPIHKWGYGHDQEHRAKQESGWYEATRENPEVGLMGRREFEQWKKEQGLPPTPISTGGLGGPKQEKPYFKADWLSPSIETMEIKPGWRPSTPETMEIRY